MSPPIALPALGNGLKPIVHFRVIQAIIFVIPDLIRDLSLVIPGNKIPAFAGMTKMEIRGKCPTGKRGLNCWEILRCPSDSSE